MWLWTVQKLCKNLDLRHHKCFMQLKRQKGGRCTFGCMNCAPPKFIEQDIETIEDNITEHDCIVNQCDVTTLARKNYKKLILTRHSDKGGKHEDCTKLTNAYSSLGNLSPFTCSTFHANSELFETLDIKCENYTGPKRTVKKVRIQLPQEINPDCSYTEKYIFFDYETQQETGTHIPSCICAHYFDGTRFDFETNEEFCKWLISKRHVGYTGIAHYAKAFDSQFMLQYCINQGGLNPDVICNGTKIMYLEIKTLKLKIIDSFNFVAEPLSSFPKTFGLTELCKGYFPHLFNTEENKNYIGPIPDEKFYGYNRMKTDACAAFIKWHNERVAENYIFNLKEEQLSYCHSDVDLLRRGMMTFREDFLDVANIDPLQYITIASVCLAIYRSRFLPENSIAIIDQTVNDQYSKESIGWLNSFENPDIKHALNGREVGILGERVDGFDEITNTVYQYHGCFWHGCPDCYEPDSINPVNKTKMADLYQATMNRSTAITGAGYNLVEIYSCEWKKSASYKKLQEPRNN